MFNNKKRLLSVFITAMMMCPIAKSSEDSYLENEVKNWKINIKNYDFEKTGKLYFIEYDGPALRGLHKKYERVLGGKQASGHAGVVSQYKCIVPGKNYDKTVATKCIVNPEKVKIKIKKEYIQYNSIKKEVEFFNKLKNYKYHPGIVNCYDIFYDDNVTYIVQDWIDGETLRDFLKKNQNLSLKQIQKFLYTLMKRLFEFCEFCDKIGIRYSDFHGENIMISLKKAPENSKKKYKDFDIYLVDWGEYKNYDPSAATERNEIEEAKKANKANFVMSLPQRFAYLFHRSADALFENNLKEKINISSGLKNWKTIPENFRDMCYEFSRRCSMTYFNDKGECQNWRGDWLINNGDKPGDSIIANDYDPKYPFFQSYKEVYEFCDAKIKEAEKEMEISK